MNFLASALCVAAVAAAALANTCDPDWSYSRDEMKLYTAADNTSYFELVHDADFANTYPHALTALQAARRTAVSFMGLYGPSYLFVQTPKTGSPGVVDQKCKAQDAILGAAANASGPWDCSAEGKQDQIDLAKADTKANYYVTNFPACCKGRMTNYAAAGLLQPTSAGRSYSFTLLFSALFSVC